MIIFHHKIVEELRGWTDSGDVERRLGLHRLPHQPSVRIRQGDGLSKKISTNIELLPLRGISALYKAGYKAIY